MAISLTCRLHKPDRTVLYLIFLLGLLVQSLPAQQWTSYQSPPYPPINLGLRAVGNTVFFNAESGLYRSSDGGDHWERIRDYQLTDVFQVFEVNRNNHHLDYSQGIDSSGHWELYKSAGGDGQPA